MKRSELRKIIKEEIQKISQENIDANVESYAEDMKETMNLFYDQVIIDNVDQIKIKVANYVKETRGVSFSDMQQYVIKTIANTYIDYLKRNYK
jgi:hypothetical protein